MSWRDFKCDSVGFKGFKGFKFVCLPPLKPLRPLKPGEVELKGLFWEGCRANQARTETPTGETATNSPAEWAGKRPGFPGGETGEKQILLAFASPAGSEKPANSHFANPCKCLILCARRPGRRKMLRPLSVYECRLAAEARRRAVFCENHRQQLGGTCPHFDIIERLTPGDPSAALDSCLLWRLVSDSRNRRIEQGCRSKGEF